MKLQLSALAGALTLVGWFSGPALAATGPELATAMDIDDELVISASTTGDASGTGVQTSFGSVEPERGDTFALLGTGTLGAANPGETGDFFEPTELIIQVEVPEDFDRVRFDYNFITSDYDLFVGSRPDIFTVTLTDSQGDRALVSVDRYSPDVGPAGGSNAGGTGYAYPRGGATGFQTVNAAVEGGTTVTLTFKIRDQDDFFGNSVVVLDNLYFGSLEAVNPNNELLTDGRITTNRQELLEADKSVDGAATDGVTQILLRSKTSDLGTVEFCLENAAAPEDGGLGPVGLLGSFSADCAIIDVEEVDGEFVAFAVYQVPEDFFNDSETEREIEFQASFSGQNGDTTEVTLPFKLVRPPVVLIHGLWSAAATWTFPIASNGKYEITRADYQASNFVAFASNSTVASFYIKKALDKMRADNIAVAQADVVGHSMGGLLTRLHVQGPNFSRNDNFNEGDVNRLITINTPHNGSPWGSILKATRFLEFEGAMALAGMPIPPGGATDDLALDSAALASIGSTAVPSHALVGVGGAQVIDSAFSPDHDSWIDLTPVGIMEFFAETSINDIVFDGDQHDMIVSQTSQEGGLSPAGTTIIGTALSTHLRVTGSTPHSFEVDQLLNVPPSAGIFENFPAVSSLPETPSKSIANSGSQSNGRIANGTLPTNLTIVPPGNANVDSGTLVPVTVNVTGGADVQEVLLVGPFAARVDDAAPFEFELPIANSSFGALEIDAYGRTASGDLVQAQSTITLQASVPANLLSLRVEPAQDILFAIGETSQIIVNGIYDDDVVRDLRAPGAGTTFTSIDSGIASVTNAGLMTAQGLGQTLITVANGAIEASVSVRVRLANERPIANAGPDQVVSVGAEITLDSAASSDGDTGPQALSVRWTQVAGPNIGFFDPAQATVTFDADEAAAYVFSLAVNDGQETSLPDTVRVIAGAVAPVANGDVFSATEDITLNVVAPGVIGNDYDANADSLTATLITNATKGTATLTQNGGLTYVPDPGFVGTDTFTYRVNDGTADSEPATVTLVIRGGDAIFSSGFEE